MMRKTRPSFVLTPGPCISYGKQFKSPFRGRACTAFVCSLNCNFPITNINPVSANRRIILRALALSPIFPLKSRGALEYPELHGLDEKPDELPPFRNVKGVKIQDVYLGNGKRIDEGSQVSIKYVMRRSNGYFIDASYGFDRFETYSFRPGKGQVVQGFEIGVDGMFEGGRRRFVIPPALGYVKGTGKQDPGPIPPDFGARRSLSAHSREPIIFEVLVVKVKPPPES